MTGLQNNVSTVWLKSTFRKTDIHRRTNTCVAYDQEAQSADTNARNLYILFRTQFPINGNEL